MENVIFGLLAIAAGALFCFRGALAFRVLIPVWGAFVGFASGAALVASMTGEGFLQTGLAWLVALGAAALFALLAYLYYEVAVVLAMGSIGFALGASLMVALGISWNWLIILVGMALGGFLAAGAVVADLPMILLVVLSAFGGASAIVTGIMLLVRAIDTQEFSNAAVTARIGNDWWFLLYLALALFGVVVQARATDRLRRSMRDSWAGDRARA
jgi:hypothetical protein